jgi:hypothetical protein
MPVAGDCGPGVKDEAGAAHETEIRHQYRPVRSRNFPAVLIFHCYHVSPLGIACHTYILEHNHLTQFLGANFSGLYARLRMDTNVRMSNPGLPTWSTQETGVEHDLHVFGCGCTGSCFTCGMSSPGTESFEDCGRDHSGALSFRVVISRKCCCFRFCLRHSYHGILLNC